MASCPILSGCALRIRMVPGRFGLDRMLERPGSSESMTIKRDKRDWRSIIQVTSGSVHQVLEPSWTSMDLGSSWLMMTDKESVSLVQHAEVPKGGLGTLVSPSSTTLKGRV